MPGPRWRAVALLVGAFVVGIVIGAVGGRLLGPRLWGHAGRSPVEVLTRRLGLRPAQRDSVRAIFERRRPAFDSLWRDISPRVDSLEHSVSREIDAQLDPKQRTKFAELRRRLDERRHRGTPLSPPPPD